MNWKLALHILFFLLKNTESLESLCVDNTYVRDKSKKYRSISDGISVVLLSILQTKNRSLLNCSFERPLIMSDLEDDWFEKDIDEFVVQAPPSDIEQIVISKTPDGDVTRIAYIDSGLLLIIKDIFLNNEMFF